MASRKNQPAEDTRGPADIAREWAKLLDDLVPPSSIEVEDITGAKHALRANLPAAAEVRIIRRLEGIKLPDLSEIGDRISKGQRGGVTQDTIAGMVDGIARVAGDEAVLNVVADCFTMAHPRAVADATENAQADEDAAQYLPAKGKPSAVDLFSLADLVAGVVPFGLRAANRIGSTAASLLPPTS